MAEAPPKAGSFRFWFADQRWEWSDEVYRMHGYTPGEIEPTTELMLSHKHPDDRDDVAKAIARSIEQGVAFSSHHRFLDTNDVEREVMVVADRIVDEAGTAIGTAGFYIDCTATLAEYERETLTATMPELIEARAVIEQAKGVLMRMYRINARQAFAVLSWRSQETNTKLRDLAAQLIADLTLVPPSSPDVVSTFDHVLLTAHTRIPPQNRPE
ncbi:PAS and ANTAR domain-containing protein [Nocardia sp. AB354]|uniref:PAS and ANTAR domain-containing protein n=1 Tax=Nocardia sp. AB354 TaxID=3413283 RepID=UPI003C1B32B7